MRRPMAGDDSRLEDPGNAQWLTREPWDTGGGTAAAACAAAWSDRARPRGRGPRRRADRLHAVAARPRPIAPDAPSLPITIGGMAFNVPPAAIRFKVQRRPGAQARVDLSFVWPSLDPARSQRQAAADRRARRHRPAVRDHRGERQHAVAGRTAQGDLSALRRRRPDRRRRRAQPAGLPRRLALSGRGSDPGARVAGALPAPLHPPDRRDARRCACTSGASAAPT